MHKKENIDSQKNNVMSLSDERLRFESEQAILRMHYSTPDVDAEWGTFSKNLMHKSSVRASAFHKSKSHYIIGIVSSAAAILVLFFLYPVYKNITNKPITIFTARAGAQIITMHVDNKTMPITSSMVVKNINGISISSNKADFSQASSGAEQRTIETPYGKDYQIILNDGTEVTMNAGSRLTFPTQFTGNQRAVKLEGEAYFKVAKNKEKPFIVITDKMNTRAVGTEFDVKAYKGSEPNVTLVKGVVVVSLSVINRNVELLPGDDASLVGSNINVRKIDTQSAMWKDGDAYYDNTPLVEILHDIGRWYNVNVEMYDPSLENYRLHFIINKNSGINDVIDNLNDFGYLCVIKKGNILSISKNNKNMKD